MSRAVIQVGDSRVAYDGRKWTAVSGPDAELIARQMKTVELLYRQKASAHPDFVYNVAEVAAKDWRGAIVEHQPDPPGPEDAIY